MLFQTQDLLAILQDMVRIESANPTLDDTGSGEETICRYIAELLGPMGMDVQYQDLGDGRMNVIGILKGAGGGQCLMLNGHTDTVSIQGMCIDPLTPEYKDGRVYGRGSLDMKAGLAAMITATRAVIDSGARLKGDLILAFVADEEHSSLGTEALVKAYSADAAVICEPVDLRICVAHKGFTWLKVEVFGKAAHGSLPDEGVDAIVKAGKFLARLEDLSSGTLAGREHRLLGHPSIHASTIGGGIGLSTYPDYCKIELERRTIPGETLEMVEHEITGLIDTLISEDATFRATADVMFSRNPLEIDEDERIVTTLVDSYKHVMGRAPELIGIGGWMDSALLSDAGIPSVAFGPCGIGCHAASEYVDFQSVIATTEVLEATILRFCGV